MSSSLARELGGGMCFNNEILLAAAVLQGTHAADRSVRWARSRINHCNSGARNPMISTETAVAVPNLINGEWTTSSATEMLDVINPATGEVIARTPLSSAAEVGLAVKAAAAFPAWRRTPPEDRIQYLFKLKQLLEEHFDDIAPHHHAWRTARRWPKREARCAAASKTWKSPAASPC